MTTKLSCVLLALVFERFFRFNTYLQEVSLICSDAELRLVDFLRQLLKQQVDEREIKRAIRLLSLPKVSEDEENAASELLISAASHMDILLSETEVFPRQRPPLEVYDLLEKAFPNVLTNGWKLAVVLWPIYNFGADPDLTERLKKALDWMPEQPPKYVVLYLAELEKDNPLKWALLAHEMGHALDEAKNIGEIVLGTEAEEQIGMPPRWITELVADSIAIKVLGPTYFCAFASLTLLDDNPTRYYSSHPALHKRIEMLKQELGLMGVLENKTKEIVNEYYQLVMERVKGEPRFPEDTMFTWEDTFNRVREAVNKEVMEVHKFNEIDRKESETLAGLLRKGIPISSFMDEERCCSINEEAKQLLHDLRKTTGANRDKRLPDFKRRLNRIIKDFDEEPTHPIKILNAGWIDRWSELLDRCSRSGSTNEWNQWWKQVQRSDALLKKSIEAIPIHEKLRQE